MNIEESDEEEEIETAHEKDKKLKHDKLNCLFPPCNVVLATRNELEEKKHSERGIRGKNLLCAHVRLDWLLIVYLTIMVLMHKVQVSYSSSVLHFSSLKFKFTFIKVSDIFSFCFLVGL